MRCIKDVMLFAAFGLAGCDFADRLLEVEAPSQVIADELDDPTNAELLRNGMVADFECAFTDYVLGAGVFTDELADAQLFGQMWDYDRRTSSPDGIYGRSTCSGSGGVYRPLSTARFTADDLLRKLDGWSDADVPDRTRLMAEAASYAGYSLVLLGEGMCSGAIDGGPELTRAQLQTEAETRFTRALEEAQRAGATELLNLARLGRARARLNLGQTAAAAADARLVTEGFVFDATYSDVNARRYNEVWTAVNRDGTFTVEQDFRGLEFAGVPDPRVLVQDAGRLGVDGATAIWTQSKYAGIDAPMPIASWDEAQLIVAEAEVAAGNTAVAVSIINALHARVGLPAYSGGSAAEVMAQVATERHRELFLESHYLGDVARYGIVLTPLPDTDFPKGGRYGDQTCFPLPSGERLNNPNIGND